MAPSSQRLEPPQNPGRFTDVRDQILADAANVGCRQWRERHPELVTPFVTDCIDVDTPEDLDRFHRETGHALQWPAELAI
jgi:molybdenum cofactor cytidylyltransferase